MRYKSKIEVISKSRLSVMCSVCIHLIWAIDDSSRVVTTPRLNFEYLYYNTAFRFEDWSALRTRNSELGILKYGLETIEIQSGGLCLPVLGGRFPLSLFPFLSPAASYRAQRHLKYLQIAESDNKERPTTVICFDYWGCWNLVLFID